MLNAIERRNMYSVFRSSLLSRDLPVSQGWEKTKIALAGMLADPEQAQPTLASLNASYTDNILYSQKAVFLWALESQETTDYLWSNLERLVDTESPYRRTYPLPLGEDALIETRSLAVPTAVNVDGNTKSLVFAGKRWFNEEVAISPTELSDEARGEYSGITEIVAKRRVAYPVFDSISIDRPRRLVELRIDQAKNLNEQELLQFRTNLQQKFNGLAREQLGIESALGSPLNLFPAIDYLYAGTSWRVHAIEHTNDGGYLNRNRGRKRLADVREDDYHVAGEGAVTAIHLHSITACWDMDFGIPKLILHGHSKILSSEHPVVDNVRILDCWDAVSYTRVLGTIVEAISPSEQN